MVDVIWTDSAVDALNEVAEFIAIDNVNAARKLVQRVMTSTDRLHQFPESGRIIPEIAELPYRELIVNPCRILYKYHQNVVILNVLRQERDVLRYIKENGLN